jgi:sn-glycerol 3-phosphate transport system ATP-binding protein
MLNQSMSGLRLEKLTKVFPGGVRAVDDVSLAVPEGKTAAVLGPSGCGKTTLLRLVAGLESPTSGTVAIGPRVINSLPPKDRDVAMVFQSHALYPHLNVRKNLAFGLQLRGTPRLEIADRVAWVAKLLGVEGLLARMPAELSGGQRQRVALGRAIVRRPKVFLFDEPLSQLDAKLRREMRDELKQLLQQLQTTTLYVTHDHEEAQGLGDVVVVMNAGRAEQFGTVDEVFGSPSTAFVAEFIRS